jgi:hypothetical protein
MSIYRLSGVVLPFALLACGGGSPQEPSSTSESAVGACPPGYTRECTNEGLGGRVICQCVPTATHQVGGVVTGLAGSGLVLAAGDTYPSGPEFLAISGNGPYAFTDVLEGSVQIYVWQQPSNQICVVTNAYGAGESTGTVSDVNVACGHP